jgi:hypothetical protein
VSAPNTSITVPAGYTYHDVTQHIYDCYDYTRGAATRSVTLNAPAAGEYDFRYLSDDGYYDAVRRARVTVTAGTR